MRSKGIMLSLGMAPPFWANVIDANDNAQFVAANDNSVVAGDVAIAA